MWRDRERKNKWEKCETRKHISISIPISNIERFLIFSTGREASLLIGLFRFFIILFLFNLPVSIEWSWSHVLNEEREGEKKDWNKCRFSIDALFTPHLVSVWLLTIPTVTTAPIRSISNNMSWAHSKFFQINHVIDWRTHILWVLLWLYFVWLLGGIVAIHSLADENKWKNNNQNRLLYLVSSVQTNNNMFKLFRSEKCFVRV